MKFRFEPDLDYQLSAIDAVCDLFKGQDVSRTEFTVAPPVRPPILAPEPTQEELFPGEELADAMAQIELWDDGGGVGYGNRLTLLPEHVLANLQTVQLRNALAPAEALESMDFTVEMETGTGKTYVYLRTIFELNRRYGWTKFVVVVPSVAIREGVAKSWEMTRDHFRALFAGAVADLFVYDSANLGQVRNFASASSIQIMVATIGALNKLDTNIFYKTNEKTGGDAPVDLIRATRPVVILDEPQSVEGSDENSKGAKAIAAMKPLCRLRYSATHVRKHYMVYRLDAVDAYQQKLVKRIDVAGVEIVGADNTPYVKLVGVRRGKPAPTAVIEVGRQRAEGVRRETIIVRDGDDLAEATRRGVYEDVSIGDLQVKPPLLQLNLPGSVIYLAEGEAHGDVNRAEVVRKMINRTIREHFEREKSLKPLGIKVLSLFFIDRVSHYREHHDDGTTTLGPYGVMFEEEYRKLAARPEYASTLFVDRQPEPETAHDGYFSKDKKGRVTELEETAEGALKTAAMREDAERGFNLIMRDKEKLLDEATPLRFIFSHSALREGWDNPNVFQICTLREMSSERERRQTIGRGLRLCVDANGERRRDEGINVLTVIANESYAAFAEALQNQIENDLGITFGTVQPDAFAALVRVDASGKTVAMGDAGSKTLQTHLRETGLIDAKGKITDDLRRDLKDGTLELPEAAEPFAASVRALLIKLAGKLEVRDADKRRTISLNREVYLSDDFRQLWDSIKAKTTYRLHFDSEALIEDAARSLRDNIQVSRAQLRFVKRELQIDEAGVQGVNETKSDFVGLAETLAVPDVLGELQNRTQLTRRSLAQILIRSGKLDDLRRNPASFIDQAAALIMRAKTDALVDGVRYTPIGPDSYYAQELFESEELQGYLERMVEVQHAPFEAVPYDSSTIERPFAEALNSNEAVKVFAKLPSWFRVPTPLGTYNPDWAVLVSREDGDRLYLIVETKGSALLGDLKPVEQDKITCGKRHFAAIATDPKRPAFRQARNFDELLASL
jgi:type III restriction enzyme